MAEEPRAPSEEPSKSVFQFSLRVLLGLMAVAAILLTTTVYYWDVASFGVMGFMFALVVGAVRFAWARVEGRDAPTLFESLAFAGIIYVIMCILAPGVVETAWRWNPVWCRGNMKQILLALHNYHDTYGSFPPAYIADKSGKPIHSWRVLILPFIEQQGLYDLYDFNEPWDGPNNQQLISSLPDVYRCPEQRRRDTSETNYVAVIGPRTAWPGDQPTKLSDFSDGTGITLMVVEVVDSGIPWSAPQDLTFEEALKGLQKGGGRVIGAAHPVSGRLYAPTGGAALGYADEHTERLWEDVPTEHWRAVLQINDGKPTSESSRFYLSDMPP